MPEREFDQWAQWLLHRRHAGDPEELQRALAFLGPVRDRVLDNAKADGRGGDGHLQRYQDLLDHARALAERMGVLPRCRFIRAPAEDLAPMLDASVDIVTTRSVGRSSTDRPRG